MNFVIFVQVSESLCSLTNNCCNVLLCEPLLENVEEVWGRAKAEFHSHPDVLSFHVAAIVFDSIWMLQRANELNFLHDVTEFLQERERTRSDEAKRVRESERNKGLTSPLGFPPKSIFLMATKSPVSLWRAWNGHHWFELNWIELNWNTCKRREEFFLPCRQTQSFLVQFPRLFQTSPVDHPPASRLCSQSSPWFNSTQLAVRITLSDWSRCDK